MISIIYSHHNPFWQVMVLGTLGFLNPKTISCTISCFGATMSLII